MKTTILTILIISLSISTVAQNNSYKVNSTKVLATANGINYTEGHFNKALRFLEFIIGTNMSEAEKQESIQKTAEKFQANPQGVLDEVNQIDAKMLQFYQITDIMLIAKMRSALISQIYASAQNLTAEQQPFIVKLLYKYVPLLAIDAQNMLAFTYRDLEGLIYMMQFNAMMSGQNLQFTQQELVQTQTSLAQQFYYMTLEQKQYLCSMQVQYEYIYKLYNSMNEQQKQQWQNQIMNQQAYAYQNQNTADAAFQQGYQQAKQNNSYNVEWPAGVNTKAEKQAYLGQMRSNMNANTSSMNIMYDTMMGNHATMLNTIENFGDTGNYWEYK